MTDKAERLAKRIARAGLCSRREAEQWIAAGRVRVNGEKIITPAFNVTEKDSVEVDGKPLSVPEAARLWLFHKPPGVMTTHKDPQGRPTVFGLLPKDLPRVISVGRLDLNSEGLLLLTNDGALARKLELPATGWTRRYRARVHGHITQEMIAKLKRGITVDGVRYGSIALEPEEAGLSSNRWVAASLAEGKNREIRKVFGHFNCKVNRLIRTAYGPFQLGSLPRGELKEVSRKVLREQMGAL